jgi:hypothetical protein
VPLPAYGLSQVSGQLAEGELDPFLFPSRDEMWEYRPFVRMRKRMEKLTPKVKRLRSGLFKEVKNEDDEEDLGIFELSTIEQAEEPYFEVPGYPEELKIKTEEEGEVEEGEVKEQEVKEQEVKEQPNKGKEKLEEIDLPFQFSTTTSKYRTNEATTQKFKNFVSQISAGKNWSEEEKNQVLANLLISYLLQTKGLPLKKPIQFTPAQLIKPNAWNHLKQVYERIGSELKNSLNKDEQEKFKELVNYRIHPKLGIPTYFTYILALGEMGKLRKRHSIDQSILSAINYVEQIIKTKRF